MARSLVPAGRRAVQENAQHVTPDDGLRTWYGSVILAYDRVYRLLHGLDIPASEIGPVFCVDVRRSRRTRRLADGTVIRPQDLVGFLHLNNARVITLHADGLPPISVGLEFRRQLMASLEALAALVEPGGRLAQVRAFAATTIFHQGLRRFGFETEARRLRWSWLVAAYQRALLGALRAGRRARLRGATYQRAEQVWISRAELLRRHGSHASGRR
jgi:hypothetical protein